MKEEERISVVQEILKYIGSLGLKYYAEDLPVKFGNRRLYADFVVFLDKDKKHPLIIIEIVPYVSNEINIMDVSVQKAYLISSAMSDLTKYIIISDGKSFKWFARDIDGKNLIRLNSAPNTDLDILNFNLDIESLDHIQSFYDLIKRFIKVYHTSSSSSGIDLALLINKLLIANLAIARSGKNYINFFKDSNLYNLINFIDSIILEEFSNIRLQPINYSKDDIAISELIKEFLLSDFSKVPRRVISRTFWDVVRPNLNRDQLIHTTPTEISKLIADIARPLGFEEIFDPACGSGELLINALQFTDIPNRLHLYGQDLDPNIVSLAITNFLLNDLPANNLSVGDSVFDDRFKNKQFDLILLDPPVGSFVRSDFRYSSYSELKSIKTDRLEISIIFSSLQKLKPQGRLICLVPQNILRYSSFQHIREEIMRYATIEAIIQLPENSFLPVGHSGKASLVVLKRDTNSELRGSFIARIKDSKIFQEDNIHIYSEFIERYIDFQTIHTRNNASYHSSEFFDLGFVDINSNEFNSRLDVDILLRRFEPSDFNPINSLHKTKKIGDTTKIIVGRDLKWEYSNKINGVPLIKAKSVKRNYIEENDIEFVDRQYLSNKKPTFVRKGDVLLTTTGQNIGRAAVYSFDHEAIISSNVTIIRCSEELESEYVAQYFNSPVGIEQIEINATGTVIPFISMNDLRSVIIPVPNIETQLLLINHMKLALDMASQLNFIAETAINKANANFINSLFGDTKDG